MSWFLLDEPAAGGADGGGAGRFALEEKCGAVADLGDGGVDAKVPHCGSDEVGPGVKEGSQVEAFIAPVSEVAARRSVAYALSVDKQNKAVIGADADRIGGGDGREIKGTAEMEDDGLAQGCGWLGDPGSFPLAVGRVGLNRGLAAERCEDEEQGD